MSAIQTSAMAKPEKSSKNSWLGELAPIVVAVMVVAAAAFAFQLLYSGEKASKDDFANAERESFLKKHYPLDLTSAQPGAPKAPAAATSR
jgi:negative regulator of sigma E activity